jgi:NAD(P)-dependent dehydrogenase (short-subunit alcohol dehydrogenase family)
MPGTDPSSGTPIKGAAALVTGGHRGFGRTLVDELLERGAAKVYATSRSSQPQREPRIVPRLLDVADDASVAAQAASEVSIVVNDAGILLAMSVLGAPLSEIHDELETNLGIEATLVTASPQSRPCQDLPSVIPRGRTSSAVLVEAGGRRRPSRPAGRTAAWWRFDGAL